MSVHRNVVSIESKSRSLESQKDSMGLCLSQLLRDAQASAMREGGWASQAEIHRNWACAFATLTQLRVGSSGEGAFQEHP